MNSRDFRRAFFVGAAGLSLLLTACGSQAEAQQSNQQKAGVLLNSGLAAHNAGRTAEAEADYRKVLALDPQNKWAHYNLGLIEQNKGQASAAEADYRAVLAADPNFTGALYNLAILRTSPAPAEAADLYKRAITVAPNMGSAHLNLGFLLISMGQQAAGKAELDKAVAIEPALKQRIPKIVTAAAKKP
jgi:tetratricopeptide (TPR) repeat protein